MVECHDAVTVLIENDTAHFEVKLASNERESSAESQFPRPGITNNKHEHEDIDVISSI